MEFIGKGRAARRTYGFDEIALVPASATVDPSDVDLSWRVAERTFALPIVASAMDSVVDVPFAIALSRLGGMAVLNLEGVQTRYADPGDVLDRLAAVPPERVVGLMQEVYREPIKDDLVARRIQEIRGAGGAAVVSSTPAQAGRLGPLAAEAGAAVLLVQSTVITEQHRSDRGQALSLRELTAQTRCPSWPGTASPTRRRSSCSRRASPRCLWGWDPARRAPAARSSASASRRPPRSWTSPPRARSSSGARAGTCRSSPTAGSPSGGMSRRRWRAARMR